jgi:hypothetical protein
LIFFTREATLKESLTSSENDDVMSDKRSGPQGIGMAVAFDWGLAVQLLVQPFLSLLTGGAGPLRQFNMRSPMSVLLSFLISLPFAILIAIFGEGVRRGWRWTRYIQIVFNTLGFIGAFFVLANLIQSSKRGDYWPLVTVVILLIFSPLIAWRLSRPQTARWFAIVTSAEARKRHGGAWPWLIALWAIAGGVLQALATIH